MHLFSFKKNKWAASWQNQQNGICAKRRLISLGMYKKNKWAASWQNQQNGICTQRRLISLGIPPVWQSSLSARRKLGSLATHWAHSDIKTGQMSRLIWVFPGRTCHFIGIVMRRLKCWQQRKTRCPLMRSNITWAASSEFGTYRLCEQRRFRRACASAQSRQNLCCSLI